MSSGPNCCAANNVDRTNEVYVIPESGRYAFHQWENDLQTETQREVLIPEKMQRSSKSVGGDNDW